MKPWQRPWLESRVGGRCTGIRRLSFLRMQTNLPSTKFTSGAALILVVTLILIFLMAARTPLDSDMWWHLRAGEQTWLTHHIVSQDTYSYTRLGVDWINHSWLGQVVMYLLYRAGGYFSLAGGMALVSTLSVALLL